MDCLESKMEQKIIDVQTSFEEDQIIMDEKIEQYMQQNRKSFAYIKKVLNYLSQRDEQISNVMELFKKLVFEDQQRKEKMQELDFLITITSKRLDSLENNFIILKSQSDQSGHEIIGIKKGLEEINQKFDDLSTTFKSSIDEDSLNMISDSIKFMSNETQRLDIKLKKQKILLNDLFRFE